MNQGERLGNDVRKRDSAQAGAIRSVPSTYRAYRVDDQELASRTQSPSAAVSYAGCRRTQSLIAKTMSGRTQSSSDIQTSFGGPAAVAALRARGRVLAVSLEGDV